MPLSFSVDKTCTTTGARASTITFTNPTLPAANSLTTKPEETQIHVKCPIYMPVGTLGTIKGLTVKQLEDIGYRMILGNTYHLGMENV